MRSDTETCTRGLQLKQKGPTPHKLNQTVRTQREGHREDAPREGTENGAQSEEHREGRRRRVCGKGRKKNRKRAVNFVVEKRPKANDFGWSNPVFGSSPFLCWSVDFFLSVSVLFFGPGGAESTYSRCASLIIVRWFRQAPAQNAL